MIFSGIDEAGYGPLLGPLVVGSCAVELLRPEPVGFDELPDLWASLVQCASRKRSRSGRTVQIDDSKKVYSPAGGLKELERSVLVLLGAMGRFPGSLDELVEMVAPAAAASLRLHPWYVQGEEEKFPLENDPMLVRLSANAFRVESEKAGVAMRAFSARIMPERALNELFDKTRNKSNALFSVSAHLLDELVRQFGEGSLLIVCDRQGGREHYGSQLRLLFEEWALSIEHEHEGRSDYALRRGKSLVLVTFREKCETQSLPTAAASMLCKYLREALMHRYNAWWLQHVPGVKATAGYYTDGVRFLKDVAAAKKKLEIGDHMMVRSR